MSEASNVVIPMPGTTAARIAETGVLLEYPIWVGGPQRHDVVYGFVGGRVGTAPLARYRLPEGLRGGTLIAPGAANGDGLSMLPELAVIADRLAPWVAVHVVPQILRRRRQEYDFGRASGCYEVEGETYTVAGGTAFYDDRLILLEWSHPTRMASLLCHELFHILWYDHLSDAAIELLTKTVAYGAAWPGNYFGSTSERVARLFESWATARMEGLPPPPDSDGLSVLGIFELIWSGGLADHQIVRGLVPGHDALMRRRGLQPLPPPKPEPMPASPMRPRLDDVICDWIWDGVAAGVAGIGRMSRWAWRTAAAA